MIDKPEDGTGSNTELTQKYARAKVQMTNLCPHIHIQTAVTNSLLLYCVINGSDCTFYLYLYLKTTICVCFDSRQNHTCYKCITLVLVSHTQAHTSTHTHSRANSGTFCCPIFRILHIFPTFPVG